MKRTLLLIPILLLSLVAPIAWGQDTPTETPTNTPTDTPTVANTPTRTPTAVPATPTRLPIVARAPIGGVSAPYVSADLTAVPASLRVKFRNTGNQLVIVRYTGSGGAVTAVVQGVAEPRFGRTAQIAAGVDDASPIAIMGFFAPAAYNQKSGVDKGYVYVDFDSTDASVSVIEPAPK